MYTLVEKEAADKYGSKYNLQNKKQKCKGTLADTSRQKKETNIWAEWEVN